MCEPKSRGGYRCEDDVQKNRVKFTKEVHEKVMARIPEDKQPQLNKFDPSQQTLDTIVSAALKDPRFEKANNAASEARRAYIHRSNELTETLKGGGYHEFLQETDARYRRDYEDSRNPKIDTQRRLEASNAVRERVRELKVECISTEPEVPASRAMDRSPEDKAVEETTTAVLNKQQELFKEYSRTMFYGSHPEYSKAKKEFMETSEGKKYAEKAAINSLMSRVPSRSQLRKLDKQIANETSQEKKDELTRFKTQQLKLRETVGWKNQIDAFESRVKKEGSTPLTGDQTIELGGPTTGSITIVSAEEAQRRTAEDYKKGLMNTLNAEEALATKGIYVQGTPRLKKELSRRKQESNRFYEEQLNYDRKIVSL